MKRRQLIGLGLAAGAGGAWLLKPAAQGGPHDAYFAALNTLLKKNGPGRPLLVIDLDRLDRNAAKLRASQPAGKAFRVVAKSLPAPQLIKHVAGLMGTQRLMVFHQPHLNALATAMPEADLLLGKPMPVHAAATFYKNIGTGAFRPERQLQWLIDTPQRLEEYRQLAQQLGTRLRINIEIDVGLHRGGVPEPAALKPLLDMIAAHPQQLIFSGLMGYDAHVGKIPSIIASRDHSFGEACARYRNFITVLAQEQPRWITPDTCFNGAGSPTLRLHGDQRSPLNELSGGSCFVKPTDFDLELLGDLEPAAFIATPVLKVLEGTHIPGLGSASRIFSAWDPNREKTYFIYGGLWLAHYVSPPGLLDNTLYGKSSNQAIVNSSARVPLAVDDQIFLRPTQSEKVLLEFGDIAVVKGGALVDYWPVLPS
jgi:D-serine deaminase-like pyridoxal phosphate-dependent protein